MIKAKVYELRSMRLNNYDHNHGITLAIYGIEEILQDPKLSFTGMKEKHSDAVESYLYYIDEEKKHGDPDEILLGWIKQPQASTDEVNVYVPIYNTDTFTVSL